MLLMKYKFSYFYRASCIALALSFPLFSQTIQEKKMGILSSGNANAMDGESRLLLINQEIKEQENLLKKLYKKALELYLNKAPPSVYDQLLVKIKEIKENLYLSQENYQKEVASSQNQKEAYAIWQEPESSIEQLIIDFGSQDFVFLIPPEVGKIKVNINSNLPVPRASWPKMLESVLAQNGVGIKDLSPFLKEVYLLKEDNSHLQTVTKKRQDLEFYPEDARVSFILSPEPEDVRRIWYFLERFINPKTTTMQMIGRDILLFSQVKDLKELLKVYDFVASNQGNKEYKVIPLTKVKPEEMAKILAAVFDQFNETLKVTEGANAKGKGLPKSTPADINGIKVIPLANISRALFLIGTKEEIAKAEEIISTVENQVGEAKEKVIFWYTTKFTQAEELAKVLEKIYKLLIIAAPKNPEELKNDQMQIERLQRDFEEAEKNALKQIQPEPIQLYQESFYQQGGYIINPAPIEPQSIPPQQTDPLRENFIVDPKTSSIVMVVEASVLPKLKELIRKLDVPKKMVQIDILMFEKRLRRQNNIGLNLLKLGSAASQTHSTSALFNDLGTLSHPTPENAGVFQFIASRLKNGAFPAFDLAYKFLITQEDVQVNANPSIVTVNQTPATIAIKDEISINTGIFQVETAKGVTLENAYTRAQYGITITVVPTIHTQNENSKNASDEDFITLNSDIVFDSIQPSLDSRPDVSRRQIKNEVRIPNGQTVILGGLRSKTTEDQRESIPFVGEIPGFGKFFSITSQQDRTTEMFIFLTPRIIADPREDFDKMRRLEMTRRPGDIPSFLCRLNSALNREKDRLFEGTLSLIFGRPRDRYTDVEGAF